MLEFGYIDFQLLRCLKSTQYQLLPLRMRLSPLTVSQEKVPHPLSSTGKETENHSLVGASTMPHMEGMVPCP